jgi:hypothetical protein
MTRTEERLTDALGTAARAIDADTLHPLHISERRRWRPALAAAVAAAASVFLVVGLAAALTGPRSAPSRTAPPAAPAAPDRYYVEGNLSGVLGGRVRDRPEVRSMVTGAVTATVPDRSSPRAPGWDIFASAADGVFFAADPVAKGEEIFRFGLTAAGHVSGFAAVRGGLLGQPEWSAVAMAASPNGSQIAIAFDPTGLSANCASAIESRSCPQTFPSDYVVVLNTVTGKKSMWRGGLSGPGEEFNVANLSWANDGHELVFAGNECAGRSSIGVEFCGGPTEVRTLDPASGGGRLNSGRLLLQQPARYPDIAQAVISPDGSTITAVVVTQPAAPTVYDAENLSVEQISVATGDLLRVLYQRQMGVGSIPGYGIPDPLSLVPDGAGQHWLLNVGYCVGCGTGFNGRIEQGTLVPLPPTGGNLVYEAW